MKKTLRIKLMGGALVLAGALLTNTAPALAQDYGTAANYNAPAPQLDSLVSRIALYPDPLLAQIFAAAAYRIRLPRPHKVQAEHLIRRSRR
jgi:hypothetical protein